MKKTLVLSLAAILIVIIAGSFFLFNKLGCISNWSEVSNYGTLIAAFLLLCSIVFLAINWNSMREQTTLLQEQAEDQKRSTDAAVFKTIVDMLQDENTRKARKKVYEYFDKHGAIEVSSPKGVRDAAEKVCHTFEIAAALVTHKLLREESLLRVWTDTMMQSWACVKRLVYSYRDDRGWLELWRDFEKIATQYASEEKASLLNLGCPHF